MTTIARVLALSAILAAFGAVLGYVLFGMKSDYVLVSIIFGCIGAIVGALAGTAHEIVTVLRQRR